MVSGDSQETDLSSDLLSHCLLAKEQSELNAVKQSKLKKIRETLRSCMRLFVALTVIIFDFIFSAKRCAEITVNA